MSVPRDEDRARVANTGWIAAVAILIPILYVLSIGPAVAFLELIGPSNDAVTTAFMYFYYPVILLHEYTPLEGPLEWWVELWT